MPTINQLVRSPRRPPRYTPDAPALQGCPQRRGVVTQLKVIKPKKPNSAQRCVVKVRLTTGKEVTVYVPGDGTGGTLQQHSVILIKGGGPPDLPGVHYRIALGALDTGNGSPGRGGVKRRQSRSLYGVDRARVVSAK